MFLKVDKSHNNDKEINGNQQEAIKLNKKY